MDSEDWEQYRKAVQENKAKRRDKRTPEIIKLEENGFIISILTEYQFRVSKPGSEVMVDIFPTNNKFHNLKTAARGRINNNYLDFLNNIYGKDGKIISERKKTN